MYFFALNGIVKIRASLRVIIAVCFPFWEIAPPLSVPLNTQEAMGTLSIRHTKSKKNMITLPILQTPSKNKKRQVPV